MIQNLFIIIPKAYLVPKWQMSVRVATWSCSRCCCSKCCCSCWCCIIAAVVIESNSWGKYLRRIPVVMVTGRAWWMSNMSLNLTLSWSFAALVKYETRLDKNMNIVRSEREYDTVLVLYFIYKFIYKHFADCQNSFPFQRYWQNHWRFEHSQYCEEWTLTW